VTSINETAYPRYKNSFTLKELNEIYTPSQNEIELAIRVTRGDTSKFCFVVMLKSYQRLGFFISIIEIPIQIVRHIAKVIDMRMMPDISNYDKSGTRPRHIQIIRDYFKTKPCDKNARHIISKAMKDAAKTKEELADLINVAIEELTKNYYELPSFNTLIRLSKRIRSLVYHLYFKRINNLLSEEIKKQYDALLEVDQQKTFTSWKSLKDEPGAPKLKSIKFMVNYLSWIKKQNTGTSSLEGIPNVKIKQFASEAQTLNAAQMKQLEPNKKYALIAAMLAVKTSKAYDDIAEMFIKKVNRIKNRAKEDLRNYKLGQYSKTADKLIFKLKEAVLVCKAEGTKEEKYDKIDSIIAGEKADEVINDCDSHIAYSGNNYYPFMWKHYKSSRPTLFNILDNITLKTTNQDTSIEDAIQFIKKYRNSKLNWVPTIETINKGKDNQSQRQILDLSWISDLFWKMVSGGNDRKTYPEKIDRKHFEVCVFYQVIIKLKSGDLFILGSDNYSDYREQLIGWDEYNKSINEYGNRLNMNFETDAFMDNLKNWLNEMITNTDQSFPKNQYLKIVNGEAILSKPEKKKKPKQLLKIESLISERLSPVNILEILIDTEYWLNWTRYFGSVSGHETKLEEPIERFLATVFCYGCNLGPSQASKSLKKLNRKQIAWINQRYSSEEKLEKMIRLIIDAYNQFTLPKYWGNTKTAAADGTKLDVTDNNLISEYHIRYGGYGALGYYLVATNYIALFSHFIPCGVWEGVYILDTFFNSNNEDNDDIQPDTIHSDTQGQNEPIFGLSYLLGINLMPRIRNWKHLKLYRVNEDDKYEHIDELFSDTIDWDIIKMHLPDMLRVALSIKEGKITPSTILRKLGTYSKKNRLYKAFRELGRVIRTGYLMRYINDPELRSTIQSATNKNEAFNGFSKWISFGGIINENNRDEQRKIIKYNHLIANCIIFYNVFSITKILQELIMEGYSIDGDILSCISPYLTEHINRFGQYDFDLNRIPPIIEYLASILSSTG
jgi:TnpA family transposase